MEGLTDTIFYRTLPVEVGGPIKKSLTPGAHVYYWRTWEKLNTKLNQVE